MEQGQKNRTALKKALQMAAFIMIVLEALALLVRLISDLKNYLRIDIGNPIHHLIFIAIAAAVGGYTYFRESMKKKASNDPKDEEE